MKTITVVPMVRPVNKHITLSRTVHTQIKAMAEKFNVPQSEIINTFCTQALTPKRTTTPRKKR